ncbi:MAG TPA: 23S rRNA (uracil(1939)-C(5))-methyltransferase RlmD [Steroidobacteraceae bacterium]|jgi:23S rRNA (uracil1939-C5)-methyltransferase|nr:23S rRNA (uracil(1939)-C(5))-methyltransferase RlmD [Steroidobacteraceae bacterium]
MASELRSGEVHEAEVVDLAHDGRGVARVGGKTVFVEGALPGETVRFRVYKRRRMFDEASLTDIVTASPDRVTPKCAHFGVCGGCSLQHLSAAAQLEAKQRQLLDNLERIGRVEPQRVLEPIRGPAFGYRRRARLGVKYVHKKGRVLAGFREREKPYIAELRRCEILIERFATLPEELARLVDALSIRAKLPQVEVAAGDEQAALVFRVMEPPSAQDLELLREFGARHSVAIHLQSGGLDTIRPLDAAAAPLTYTVDEGRITLEFGAADFIQVNRYVNNAMIDAAMRLLEPLPTDRVLDLFCGMGNFTLPLARRAATVTGVEGDRALVAKARMNAVRNAIDNAGFHEDNLFEPGGFGSWAAGPYDLVLLDPPRAGALAIMERMAHWRPRRVVYISCHPGSLARDAGILVETQGFRLVGAGVMDMFPHTTHVESVAVFERGA